VFRSCIIVTKLPLLPPPLSPLLLLLLLLLLLPLLMFSLLRPFIDIYFPNSNFPFA
jgi:hypothetical protein